MTALACPSRRPQISITVSARFARLAVVAFRWSTPDSHPLPFCLHDCCLLVPRLTALQSFSVSSLGPSHPSTSEIHNSWSGITFILFSISCFTCDSLHFHTIFIPPGLIFTPPRAHRPAAVSHPSRKTDSPPNQDPSMIHSPPALPITNSSRLRFIHREPLFIHSQSNC